MVYTVTQHCRQTVIDIVEEEWQQGELEKEIGKKGKSEIEESQLLRGRPSMEATIQRVGTF